MPRQTAEEFAEQFAKDLYAAEIEWLPREGKELLAKMMTARDAEIAEEARREERDACAQVAFRYNGVQALARYSIGESIRNRVRP